LCGAKCRRRASTTFPTGGRFQFQTLSESIVRNDIDVRRNRLFAVCDAFVRRTVAHHHGIESVAKGVHGTAHGPQRATRASLSRRIDKSSRQWLTMRTQVLRLRVEEYARLDRVVAFSMAHLSADVCAQYELGVTESDLADAQDDDDDGVVQRKLIWSAPARLRCSHHKLAASRAPEMQRMNAWALAQVSATEKEKKSWQRRTYIYIKRRSFHNFRHCRLESALQRLERLLAGAAFDHTFFARLLLPILLMRSTVSAMLLNVGVSVKPAELRKMPYTCSHQSCVHRAQLKQLRLRVLGLVFQRPSNAVANTLGTVSKSKQTSPRARRAQNSRRKISKPAKRRRVASGNLPSNLRSVPSLPRYLRCTRGSMA
jgi:hypothetical protein